MMANNNYVVVVQDKWGRLCSRITPSGKEVEFRELFEKSQDAERYAMRRLVQDCEPGSYALISSTRMMAKDGSPLTIKITREECFPKQFPKVKGPAVKVTSSKNARLTFGMTCHQTRVTFSHG